MVRLVKYLNHGLENWVTPCYDSEVTFRGTERGSRTLSGKDALTSVEMEDFFLYWVTDAIVRARIGGTVDIDNVTCDGLTCVECTVTVITGQRKGESRIQHREQSVREWK